MVEDGQELLDRFNKSGWNLVSVGQVAVVVGLCFVHPVLGGAGGAMVSADWYVEATMETLLFTVAGHWVNRAAFVNDLIRTAMRDAGCA